MDQELKALLNFMMVGTGTSYLGGTRYVIGKTTIGPLYIYTMQVQGKEHRMTEQETKRTGRAGRKTGLIIGLIIVTPLKLIRALILGLLAFFLTFWEEMQDYFQTWWEVWNS